MQLKKEHIKTISLESIRILFIMLWIYTAMVKFGNMDYNISSMRKQLFTVGVADFLAYLVPALALGTVGLLVYRVAWGLWASIILLSSFSLYILVFFAEIFGRETCSCAGIFPQLSYKGHLLFNTLMLLVAITGLIIRHKSLYGEAENRQQSRHYNTIL